MKYRFTVHFLSILLCFLILFSMGSVYAVWEYSDGGISDEQEDFYVTLVDFEFRPEDVVPGGSVEAEIGENHLLLIKNVLNEDDYGLNATKKPIIHELLNQEGDVVYCDQNVQGGNLKHVMLDSYANAEKLYFVIEWISDSEYHIYTFAAYLLDQPVGTPIQVYKTVLEEDDDGVWTAPRSYIGYAEVNDPDVVSRGIDVTSWVEE